ncbi:MAG: GDP-mannose 4,6-dehydratase [Actinomycetota bacterium]|nr:GDP-mannose 4,6-dehydratase [Actinomycetota bacterium]
MNILITGGAGFIGSNLTDRLLENGSRILCLDNFNDFYNPHIKENNIRHHLENKNFTLIKGDILDRNLLLDIFSRNNIDIVIHLAAMAGVRPSIENPLLYEKVNIEGTINLLECMKTHKARKMLFASSSSVYGGNKKVPFSETDSVDRPISPYAATKKACELLCYNYHHLYSFDIFCLRFFTVYGPRQRPEMAIHKFTRQIYSGQNITVFGDGSSSRDYTYIDDIVNGLLNCIDRVNSYEIINLGNSNPTKLIELVKLIQNISGRKSGITKEEMKPGDVFTTFADIKKAKKIIAFKPETSIEDGLQKFISWYEENLKDGKLYE